MRKLLIAILVFLLVWACKKDMDITCADCDLTHIDYNPKPYKIIRPAGFGEMPIPTDNPLTEEGIRLGRFLFYDPVLSSDSTISCGSCHKQEFGFTDGKAVSPGVNGTLGTRSSMSLFNVGYYDTGLFWDGRSSTLEKQALEPVENPVEMHEHWPNVEKKLQRSKIYPEMFRKAFGIKEKKEMTRELAAKALAQFMRTILSYNSRFDEIFLRQEGFPTEQELRGYDMFFNTSLDLPDAQCGHCHNGFLLTNNGYFNNGLDSVANLKDYKDGGRGVITGQYFDYGKFRAPTLRNIGYTSPFMHDGRFSTIEQVMNHYVDHIKNVVNLDANLAILDLTPSQVQDVLEFLKMLDDPSAISDPQYSNPFK